MTDPFEVLPPEVYLHIASFLEVHNVPALACVSRHWHGLLEQDTFWKGLYVRRFVLHQGTLPQPFPRKAAWPATRRSGGSGGDDDIDLESRWPPASPASQRHRAQAQAQALLEADAVEREAEERRLAEEEMHRLRHDLPIDAPHAWKTCYRRRLRMKEGTCLVFMVGSNSLPYAADVVDKLYTQGVKVNSTCIIQQSYDEAGPPKGWEEDLLDHLHHHSVVIFFSNIAGGSDVVRNQIGNHLADFVESGGSVVLLAFATCNVSESPGGRWQENNYFPVLTAGQTSIRVELDRQSEGIDHHLLHGVRHAFVSYHGVGSAHDKAKVIGQWSDKTPAMARLKAQRGTVIAVNFFPPSMDIGDGGWPPQGSARWTAREDNSSARAWMYQLMDQLARTSTTNEAERDDEIAPMASVSPTGDGDVTPIPIDDPVPTLSGGSAELIAGMEIPPELTALLREVGEMSANSGNDPWETLLTRIDSDENAEEADTGADSGSGDDNENTTERMEVAAAEVASETSRVEQKRSTDEIVANDALVMLSNAIKYALRKASRLEPRKGFSEPSPGQHSTGRPSAGSKKPSCLLG